MRFIHIANAIEDPRSLANPLVAGEFGLRFYAAAPLKTKDGYNLGTLCVIDHTPREITGEEEKILEDLAAIVMDEMELRLASRRAVRIQTEMLEIAAHDMKSPMINISSLSALIHKVDNKDKIDELTSHIKKSSDRMIRLIDGLLESAVISAGKINLKKEIIYISEIATEVYQINLGSAKAKGQNLTLTI